ncbi:MAG: response regulator [Nitrospinota bacterium]
MANQLLLVDDSPLIHRVVELTFEGQDFEVHAADSPEQALVLARNLRPDVVVASAEMKGGGGADICRRLREEANLEKTPMLLLTSARSSLGEGDARKAGAAGVLIKPFEPERLLAEVERVMARGAIAGEGAPSGPQGAGAPSGAGPPGQEAPSGQELFEDQELEALFAGGSEQPVELPAQAHEETTMFHEEENVPGQAAAAAPPQPGAPEGAEEEIKLFDDSELGDLFATEVQEKAPATEESGVLQERMEEEWADLDLGLEIAPPPSGPGSRKDLADVAQEQASAAEAQIAELSAELALSGPAPSEEDVQAVESEIEDLQQELTRDLAEAGALDWQAATESARAGPPRDEPALQSDDDLLALAAEAGFGAPAARGPTASPDPPVEDELDLEAELAAAGAAHPSGGELAGMGDPAEEKFLLPGEPEEAPAPAARAAGAAVAAPSPASPGAGPADLEPLMKEGLERTVEAIVPALIRNIEALVVQQLPGLVEKIVLREIEKIKRGE